jgi:hypothetical protein
VADTVAVPTLWLWIVLPIAFVGCVAIWYDVVDPVLAAIARLAKRYSTRWYSFWSGIE